MNTTMFSTTLAMLQPVQVNLPQAHTPSPCRAPALRTQPPAGPAGISGRSDSQAGPASAAAPCLPRHRQRRGVPCRALDLAAADALHAAVSSMPHGAISQSLLRQLSELSPHLSLAYERVTLPCSSMNCGDAIYRRCHALSPQTLKLSQAVCRNMLYCQIWL